MYSSRGRRPHKNKDNPPFMIQAIEQVATAAEHRARFLAEAGVVRKTLLKSGKGYAVDDVHVYIGAARAFARRRRCTGRWHDAWRRLTPDVRGPRPLGRVGVSTGAPGVMLAVCALS